MGIKSIKAIQNNFHSDPLFDYQNMVHFNKKEPITNNYKFLKQLGSGTFADVFLAENIHTGHKRAIKKINTVKFPRTMNMTMNQMSMLKALDHPSILKLYQIYEDAEFAYIVTQLCEGKELFDVILDKHYFSQDQSCYIFYDILTAVKCMHDHHIMHRDLKPENIMYDEKKKILKIIDFGSGCRFENSEIKPRKRVGTSYYIAPEVLERSYNEKCDIWSMGIILYILLSGQPPITGKDDLKIVEEIKAGKEISFNKEIWKKVSIGAKKFILKMLERDVFKRISVTAALKDEWFNDHLFKRKLDENQQRNIAYHLRNMSKYKDVEATPLQEGIFIFIINFVKDKSDQHEMIRSFKELDLNGDGVVSLEELQIGLVKFLKVDQNQAMYVAKKIFQKVDINRSGTIDYSEFVMSATNIEITITEDNLDIAFDYIDADKSGFLSVSEIREKLGSNISQQMYQNLLTEFDQNNDGQISREEFKDMMKALVKKKKA